MPHELPEHLRHTANLLSTSLLQRPSEKAPEVPGDLLADLTARFTSAPAATLAPQNHSWFRAAVSFVSRPVFGLAAASALVAIIVAPTLMKPDEPTVFRGGVTTQSDIDAASIILVGAPDGTLEILQSSGYFDSSAFAAEAAPSSSSKVIVDYNSSLILAIDSKGKTVFTTEIPARDEDLRDAIATALSNF